MNLIVNVILRSERLVSISFRILRFKRFKCQVLSIPKFYQIASNSGCLIAGCCFSRQSDEDVLLPNQEKRQSFIDTNVPNVESHYRKLSSRHHSAKEFENMKRKSEYTDGFAVDQNSCSTLEPEQKKTKTDETSTPDKSEQQNLSQTVGESSSAVTEQFKEKPKERPNYFVAVQISNPQIHQALKEVQDHILEQEGQLKRSMTKLNTLHITLMVMHIGDTETHNRAVKALQNVHREHDKDLSKTPLHLEFKGLSHFQNRVLYAQLSKDDGYQRLCSLAKSTTQHFADACIHTTDSREKFTPHLTVAKIEFKGNKKSIKKIDPLLYKEFTNQYFGSQRIESIQLLSMLNCKNEAGYYSGDELYFSAFNPNDRINSLKEKFSIEKQKKDIKEKINNLMKEKVK